MTGCSCSSALLHLKKTFASAVCLTHYATHIQHLHRSLFRTQVHGIQLPALKPVLMCNATLLDVCVCISPARDCVHWVECSSVSRCYVAVAGHCASPSLHGKRQYSSASRRMTSCQRLPCTSRMLARPQHGTHGGSQLSKAMLTMTS